MAIDTLNKHIENGVYLRTWELEFAQSILSHFGLKEPVVSIRVESG